MKLLLVGASRGAGRLALEEGVRRGHAVTALVCDPGSLAGIGGVVVVHGDALDPTAVRRAAAARDAVITTLGPRVGSPPDLCARATRILLEAMHALAVRRLVMVTGAMVGHPRDRLGHVYRWMLRLAPAALRDRLADRRESERLVRESGLDWTLVHPPMLVDRPARGRYRAGEDLRLSSFAKLPRADLGRFLLDEVERGAWRGRAVAVAEV